MLATEQLVQIGAGSVKGDQRDDNRRPINADPRFDEKRFHVTCSKSWS